MTDYKTKHQAFVANILKAVDASDLRDIQAISSAVDGGDARNVVPDVLTGAPVAARGSDADGQIARNIQPAPQEGTSALYQQLAGRLTGLEKSVKSLVDALVKASDEDGNEDEEKSNKDEIGKSLRKGRIAVRKAGDDEDEDEFKKAESVLKSIADAISKAEDDAESDEDEKATEKARSELKTLKTALKAIADKRIEKAAPAIVAEPVRDAPVTVKAEEIEAAAFATIATSKGITVAQLMATLATSAINAPPTFTKANAANPGAFMVKAEQAYQSGKITSAEHLRAESVVGRIGAVAVGLYPAEDLSKEIASFSPNLREVFAV